MSHWNDADDDYDFSDEKDFRDAMMQIMHPGAKKADAGVKVTTPTKVWRIEMPNGRGPFNPYDDEEKSEAIYIHLSGEAKDHSWDCTRFAHGEQCGYTEQPFREAHGHADYGCESIDAIKAWFPDPARQWLRDEHKAVCIEYEIQEGQYILHLGKHGEVVFDCHSAKKNAVLDPLTFEPIHTA